MVKSVLTFAALAVTLAAPSLGQEQTPTPTQPPPPDTVQAPRPIPAAEIPQRAEEATGRLRDVRRNVRPVEGVAQIKTQAPELFQTVAEQRAQLDSTGLDRLTERRLADAKQQWNTYRTQLVDWGGTVANRSQQLAEFADRLQRARGEWTMTADSAVVEELPDALIERVASVIQLADSVVSELRVRRDTVLELQNLVSEYSVLVDDVLTAIDAEEAERRQRILSRDSRPFWSALSSPRDTVPVARRLADSWNDNVATVREYLRTHDSRVDMNLLLFLILLAVLIALQRRSKSWDLEDPDLGASAHFVNRPVSSAFLVSLVITSVAHPEPPAAVRTINLLAGLIPVLRLIPSSVYRRMGLVVYGIAALFVVNQLYEILLEPGPLRRILLLGVSAAAFAGCLWLRAQERQSTSARVLRKVMLAAATVGAVVLGLSVISNLWGAVAFADLLTAATLLSIYLLIVLYASAEVVTGLFRLALRSGVAQSLSSIRRHRQLVVARGTRIISLATLSVWIWGSLGAFRMWDVTVSAVGAVMTADLAIGTMNVSLGDVAAFVLAIWVSLQVSRFVRFILSEDILPRTTLARGVPATITMLVHYAIIGVGFMIAVAAAGIELSRLALIAGALGVGIGFGLQSVVNNFVSGLILAFERPIQVGDVVEMGELWGTVRRIGIRSSTIRTFAGAEVIVPNGTLTASDVTNWTLSDRLRRLEIPVGVAYGTDPHRVLELLIAVAEKHEDILGQPEPRALFLGFGESSLDFQLWCWTAQFDRFRGISSEVTMLIHDALKEDGIEIPFPQRDLHVRSMDDRVARKLEGGALLSKGPRDLPVDAESASQ